MFCELFKGGLASGLDGGDDAASCVHNFHIGFARQAHFKFHGAVTRPDNVGVGVDETGEDDFLMEVDRGFLGVFELHGFGGADVDDFIVEDEDGAILDDGEIVHVVPAARSAGEGEDL